MSSSSAVFVEPSIESLEYYYERQSSDGTEYWALKEEYWSLDCPRTYIIGPIQEQSQWLCLEARCGGIFTRKADLERHIKTIHYPSPPQFDCPKKGCSRTGEDGFTREDHLKEHLRNYHK